MALMVHSGVSAVELNPQTEHWELLPGSTSVGEMLNLNGLYYQVLSISGRDVTVGRMHFPSTAQRFTISTSTMYPTYLSNTLRTAPPAAILPPPPGPPADLEPPVWPLWLRVVPTPDLPPPVCLEIPLVGDLVLFPQFRNGERIDPLTRETPSETAARESREREAKQWFAEMETEQEYEHAHWWKFWRKRSA
jgi:hypothetical protein